MNEDDGRGRVRGRKWDRKAQERKIEVCPLAKISAGAHGNYL